MAGVKRGSLLVLIALLAAACDSSAARSEASPTPTPITVASPSPQPTSEPPLSSPSAPTPKVLTGYTFPVQVKFSCRIPAQLNRATDDATPPGFLDLTTGRFLSDPNSRMSKVLGSWDDWHTVVKPVLRGFLGVTYSWSARRWLPADRAAVSPDGLHYAYPEVPKPNVGLKLHVVDLRTGADRVVSTGVNWGIVDYRSDGIYVAKTTYYSGEGNAGLWRINPITGSVLMVLPETATTLSLGGGAAWGSDHALEPTVLYRYDLATGLRTVWFARSNTFVEYRGAVSDGRPLVNTWSGNASPTFSLMLLSGPSRGSVLYTSGAQEVAPGRGPAITDSHGVWLGSTAGLWLLQPNGKLIKVTSAPVYPLGDCR